jgi:low temperature requirement protein LtrA
LFNKQSLLFVKAKYLCYNFFNLSIEIFFLYLDRLLVGNRKYLVFLTIIASLILIGIFGITSILRIRNSYISARLAIKVDRIFAVSI